jgi:ligand-binding sensor domain-containing protein
MTFAIKTGFVFGIVLFPLCFSCLPQSSFKFEHIGSEEGLSQSSVNCVLQDRYGMIWFGTQDGLNLYDGKTFRVFQNQPGDTTSLSNNYIVTMCEDPDGDLWIGTMGGGLNHFNRTSERFMVFNHNPEITGSISDNTIWSLTVDSDGVLWIGTSHGLNKLIRGENKFKIYMPEKDNDNSLPSMMVTSLKEDSRGRLWIGTTSGIARYNRSDDTFLRLPLHSGAEVNGTNIVWTFTEIIPDRMLLGTDNGACILDTAFNYNVILEGSKENQTIIWSSIADHKGGLWLGTNQGLKYYNFKNQSVTVYQNNPADPKSIPDNTVWCLHIDAAENLWIGTNNGIGKTYIGATKFHHLSKQDGVSLSLSDKWVNTIVEDNSGNLWIGTQGGGLNQVIPGSGKVNVYNDRNSGLSCNNIWSVIQDKDNNIWIGTYPGGLNFLDMGTQIFRVFKSHPGDPCGLSNDRILALLEDHQGMIWIGTRGGGLDRYNPSTGCFKTYKNVEDDSNSLSGNTVLSLAEDHRGSLWVGTYEGGLNRYDPVNDIFTSYNITSFSPGRISNNSIWAILPDSKGRLWVGTQGGLNLVVDPDKEMSFIDFTTKDGLPGNTIIGLAEDNHGNIWMSTFRGIVKLNIDLLETRLNKMTEKQHRKEFQFESLFHVYDMSDGLQGIEFNQGSYHKGKSGKIYFGGVNGLTYFLPDSVTSCSFIPPVMITGVRIYNQTVGILPLAQNDNHNKNMVIVRDGSYFFTSQVSYLDEIILTYRESVITFDFTALDFTSPEKNQYAYMMENFDRDWNFVGNQNSATYTNLDPGKYVFRVKGTNADGVWNLEGKSLMINILPPFWQTTWFIMLGSITGTILIVFVVLVLIRNQKKKALRDKEFVELQLKTIKNQIDPHFTFNAMNAIASFIYSEKPDVVYDYFTRFARLIRSTLEDSERISRRLDEELQFVNNYLEIQKIRYKDKFTFSCVIDKSLTGDTPIPKMILQTYVENAIKHGIIPKKGKGTLQIKVLRENNAVKIIVEDDGVGRQKASESGISLTRKGLQIIKTIMDLYIKLYRTTIDQQIIDLYDPDGNPSGTRVIITIIQ